MAHKEDQFINAYHHPTNEFVYSFKNIIDNDFMSKQATKSTIKDVPPNQKIHVSQAVMHVAHRINSLEHLYNAQFKALENKIGDHEVQFIENAPDVDKLMDLIRLHGSQVNQLEKRIIELEKQSGIKPPLKKKGGTVPLTDLEDPPSFS